MQKRLIAWRKFHDLTQKDMASKLGIDLRTYSNKERGISQFRADEMFEIARILQKDITEIFLPTSSMDKEANLP